MNRACIISIIIHSMDNSAFCRRLENILCSIILLPNVFAKSIDKKKFQYFLRILSSKDEKNISTGWKIFF